jgi:hypothetical protein
MTRLTTRGFHWSVVVVSLMICSYVLLDAQSGCPTVSQSVSSNGVTSWGLQASSNVSVSVQVVDGSQGNFSESQVSAVSTASSGLISAVNQIPGSNVTQTVENTDTPPNLNDGTTTNPIIEVVMATQAQINAAGCVGDSACTNWKNDGNGHLLNATILVLPSAVDSSTTFEQMMTHEFGHSDLGEKDCDGCANTIMNPSITSSSPKSPTSCDDTRIKGCECKK